MLKIIEPNLKGASLGCRAASLKNGSRIYEIPANGIHCAELDQRHLAWWFLAHVIGLFHRVGYVEPIECLHAQESKKWTRWGRSLPSSFIRNFTMVRARHANGGAVPKESRLENKGIVRGTIYVGIRICTKYSFFIKPTVVSILAAM